MPRRPRENSRIRPVVVRRLNRFGTSVRACFPDQVSPARNKIAIDAERNCERERSGRLGKEFVDDAGRKAGRTARIRVEAAPARTYLGENLFAATDHRLIEGSRALHLLKQHGRDHVIVEKGGPTIGDLVFQRDLQVPCHRFRGCDALPVTDHRCLHPLQLALLTCPMKSMSEGSIATE